MDKTWNVTGGGPLLCDTSGQTLGCVSGSVTMSPVPPPGPDTDHLQTHVDSARFVVPCVMIPLVLVMGVPGNLLSIAVLTRRCMRSSTNHYLAVLAVYDLLYLLSAFSLAVKHYTDVTGLRWYNIYKYHFGIPFTNTCSNTGVWLTLTFTIERYIVVCHPMRGKALCTPERAKFVILAVCTLAGVLTFPDFFGQTVVSQVRVSGGRNVTVYRRLDTDLGKRPSYSVGYNYFTQVLFTFVPLLLLLVFNAFLIRAVMKATSLRKNMAKLSVGQNDKYVRQNRNQHRITIMLITVVIVFLVCQTPQAVQNIMLAYYVHQKAMTRVHGQYFTITANVFNLLVMLNASVNFALYSAFSVKFRATFMQLFCRCIKASPKGGIRYPFSDGSTIQTTLMDESHSHLLHSSSPQSNVKGRLFQINSNSPQSSVKGRVGLINGSPLATYKLKPGLSKGSPDSRRHTKSDRNGSTFHKHGKADGTQHDPWLHSGFGLISPQQKYCYKKRTDRQVSQL